MEKKRQRMKSFVIFWAKHMVLISCILWIIGTILFGFLLFGNIPPMSSLVNMIIRGVVLIAASFMSLIIGICIYSIILDDCYNMNKRHKLRVNIDKIYNNEPENEKAKS